MDTILGLIQYFVDLGDLTGQRHVASGIEPLILRGPKGC